MDRSTFKALPRLYPIVDADSLSRAGLSLGVFAHALRSAGVRFLQYRDKKGSDEAVLQQSRLLRGIFPASDSVLVLNDRAHLIEAAGFDGLHIGQEDMSPIDARQQIGPDRLLGFSTHNARQLEADGAMPTDYVAIGPVFGTQSKEKPDPVVGIEGVQSARALTSKPLVAIGGITAGSAPSIFDAGADSIALISALLPRDGQSVAKVMEDFLARIG